LTNGTAYYFKVAATNSVGTGSDSAASAAATTTLPTQTVTWSPTTALTTAQSPNTPLAASSSGDGAITYAVTSAGTTGCTINSSTRVLTFTTVGNCVVRAAADTTSNYLTGYIDATFTVTVAAPAFTLSSGSESKTQNTSITGYTISSTAGTIASYAISPSAPTGLTFSTSTGLLTGTPTTVQTATVYTITATNATGSASQTFTLTVTAATCATGGECVVGQTGPGGGQVFYVHPSGKFNCGATLGQTCKYLEVAMPEGTQWSGTRYAWSGITNQLVGTSEVIGTGLKNTLAMVLQSSTENRAGTIARKYRGNGLADWYLPSKDELNMLYLKKANISGTWAQAYWSSSEDGNAGAWSHYFNYPGIDNGWHVSHLKSFTGNPLTAVRPVRAFG
jgi:hypothetical protein